MYIILSYILIKVLYKILIYIKMIYDFNFLVINTNFFVDVNYEKLWKSKYISKIFQIKIKIL